MAEVNRVTAIPLSTIAFSGINNSTFSVMNVNGTTEPCFFMRILNDTNADLFISYDGTTVHDRIAAINTFTTEPHSLEIIFAEPGGIHTEWKKGLKVYGMYDGSAASSGNVYISGYTHHKS